MHFFVKYLAALTIVFSVGSVYGQPMEQACPLVAKRATVDGGVISYLQGGTGQKILLLHGLFAQKEQWTEVGCALATKGFDVIAPDLPGYGASNGYPISVYPLESQVGLLHQFMQQINHGPIHIAGSSMGGEIAALYANHYPQQIRSLAFIGAPMGVIAWSGQVRETIFQGINPFIPINEQQLDLEMRLLFFQPPVIGTEIKSQLIKEYVQNNRHYQQVWDIVNFYGNSLNQISKQSVNTLIIWGKQDGIFNISGLPILEKQFPRSQSHALADAAHRLMLEKPKEIVDIYLNFLKR
jgi:abhydrolase domain-containing protein 6